MKNIIKIILLALCVATLSLSLVSCDIVDKIMGAIGGNGEGEGEGEGNGEGEGEGEGENNEPELDYYTVTLDDGTGNAVTGIQVKLVDAEGNEAAKSIVGMAGERVAGRADLVSVTSGAYTVSLTSISGAGIYYDKTTTIDETDRSITVKIYNKIPPKSRDLMGDGISGEVAAPTMDMGFYYGTIKAGMNYFVFNPEREGIYEVRVRLDGANGTLGNYGIPDYVLKSVETVSDGTLSVEIPPIISEGGCPNVIGINSSAIAAGYIEIVRVSDLPNRPQYAPWTSVQPTISLKPFDLPYDNASLDMIDITDPGVKVVLGADGYYHLGNENGKIVYVYVTQAVKDGYLDAAFTTIADLQTFGHYVYDDDGNFIRKEQFNDMLYQYAEYCDENTGVYPLTEDLAYAIKSFGNSQGWYKLDNEEFSIFGEDAASVVAENAWLFACATLSLDTELGTSVTRPLSLYGDGRVQAEADQNYYFNVLGEGITVTVKDADGVITVYANGTTYTATAGEISFTLNSGVTSFYLKAAEDTLVEYTSNIQQ